MVTHLKRALIRRTVAFAVFAVVFVAVRALTPTTMTFEQHEAEQPAKPAVTKIDRLFQAGDCWTGEAPTDVTMPGHVVLRKTVNDKPAYLGPKWVGRALEQIFEGKDHGIYQINGFCR